jgi:hypothetical protein
MQDVLGMRLLTIKPMTPCTAPIASSPRPSAPQPNMDTNTGSIVRTTARLRNPPVHQNLLLLHDVDKAVRSRRPTSLNSRWCQQVASRESSMRDTRSVIRVHRLGRHLSLRDHSNDRVAQFQRRPGLCALFVVNNWISNHDLVIVPEVELGWQGRLPGYLVRFGKRKFVLQMDSDQITVKNLLSIPMPTKGAPCCRTHPS